jgi:hypothetical protein
MREEKCITKVHKRGRKEEKSDEDEKKRLKCNEAFFPLKLNFFSHRKEDFFSSLEKSQTQMEISC